MPERCRRGRAIHGGLKHPLRDARRYTPPLRGLPSHRKKRPVPPAPQTKRNRRIVSSHALYTPKQTYEHVKLFRDTPQAATTRPWIVLDPLHY